MRNTFYTVIAALSLIFFRAISRHVGGTFEVPCAVNGLALNMIFGTITIDNINSRLIIKQ